MLDVTNATVNKDEILIVDALISERQGKLLRDAIKKYGKTYSNEVKFEFDKLFSVCVDCDLVSTRSNMKKAWGERCKPCWEVYREKRKEIWFREHDKQKDFERQIRKLKLHLATPQGRVDSIGMSIIESNIRISLSENGGTFKEMAEYIGVSTSVIYTLFKRKYIRVERLLQICQYLKTPLSKILEIPIGVTIRRIQGVPIHMVRGRVPYLDESIPRNL